MMSLPKPVVLTTNAGPGAIQQIDDTLEQIWLDNSHVPPSIRIQVGIAVGEIAANIIKYAVDGPQVQIRMEVAVMPNQVRVEFVDDGRPAQIDLNAVTLPDPMAESGRGLALAQASLESLTYRRTSANCWTLVSKPFA